MSNEEQSIALEDACGLVRKRYCPEGNVHTPGKYLSGSVLTGKTARQIYDQFTSNDWGDDVPKYWSYLGNTLGDEAFSEEDGWFHEVKVNLPLIGEWRMTGSADGTKAINNYVFVGEHKAHTDSSAWKEEKAFRQGAFYLACMWQMVQSGTTTFNTAEWVKGSETWGWPEGAIPGGIVVGIAERGPPGIVWGRELTLADIEGIFDFYRNKALCLVEAIEKRDRSIAIQWDEDHRDEIGDAFVPMLMDETDPIENIMSLYEKAKDERTKAEGREKQYKARIEKLLKDNGLWEKLYDGGITINEHTIKAHRQKGAARGDLAKLREAGMYDYIIEGSEFEVVRIR